MIYLEAKAKLTQAMIERNFVANTMKRYNSVLRNFFGFSKVTDALELNEEMAKSIMLHKQSISRFGRNTIDVLKVLRELKSMNIGVYFEIKNLDSLDSSQYLMIELIASIAQDESKNRSENIKWGMRHSMSCGNIILNDKNFLGYRKNPTGDLVIVEDEAKIVRIIFSFFARIRIPKN